MQIRGNIEYEIQFTRPDIKRNCLFCKGTFYYQNHTFGSRARGTNTERSDIDIAVYGGDFDGFTGILRKNTFSLMFDIVQADVSISDELKEEIEKDGVVIYEKA